MGGKRDWLGACQKIVGSLPLHIPFSLPFELAVTGAVGFGTGFRGIAGIGPQGGGPGRGG